MTKEKLDLGKAFEKLKTDPDKNMFKMLIQAEKYLRENKKDEFKYAYAYGMLAGAIKAYLITETPLWYEDITEAIETQGEGQS